MATTMDRDARERRLDAVPYLVVSADSHVGPRMADQLREYCPQQYLEQFDEETVVEEGERAATVVSGDLVERNMADAAARAGQNDPVVRERDMDADGVAADVIFHGTMNNQMIPFVTTTQFHRSRYGSTMDTSAEMEAVGCRIYNRWLADFCSGSPERHVGLAHIPVIDVDAAVREVEWAREAGLRGVNFPAPRRTWANYTEDVYEPLWAACAANGMSLNTHVGGGELWPPHQGPFSMSVHIMEAPFAARRGIWFMIFSGVFERHPSLTMVISEVAGFWIPELLRDLDDVYFASVNPQIREFLPKPPSEYWLSNCYAAASCMSHAEAELFATPAGETLMWGSDYPHMEGTYPYTRLALRKTFAGIPEPHARALLGETAARVYDLDVAALRTVADRIGPLPEELAQPYDGAPEGYTGIAFRERSTWA